MIESPVRLKALRETALLDSLPEESFDRYVRLSARVLDVPVTLVSLVDEDRQFFKSLIGLPEPWASTRETPLSHSFCQYVVVADAPLVVSDARAHELVKDNLAIPDLGVIAYAGMPLHAPDGSPIGALCAIDSKPHDWTEDQLEVLRDLADAVSSEISLRVAAARQRTFVDTVSHELRTPLAALQIRLEDVSLWDSVDSQIHQELHVALSDIDRLAGAVTTLLEGARGDLLGGVDQVDIPELAEQVVAQWRERVGDDGRALRLGSSGPVLVQVPAAVFRQLLTVLIDNALEHGRGDIVVTVREEAGHARVRVQDEGTGVPDEVAALVLTRPIAGPAATLGQAAEWARSFGGRLVVHPGSPTSFEIVLPAR